MPVVSRAIDLQHTAPRVQLALDSVGVTGVERTIRLADGVLYAARLDAQVDLSHARMGVHMSRFHEMFSEAIDEAILAAGPLAIDQLAARIAQAVVDRQDGTRSLVDIRAATHVADETPVSGLVTQEPVELIGMAAAGSGTTRRIAGVSAVGINACPCAQGLVRTQAETDLADAGFSPQQVETVLGVVPLATHNQRGQGTLLIGVDSSDGPSPDAGVLVDVVRDSMSARIHELLKRSDELHVVTAAHANPKFVEDGVRDMLAGVLDDSRLVLADRDIVSGRLVNFESIHTHEVFAERTGTVRDLRAELVNPSHPAERFGVAQWLVHDVVSSAWAISSQ